MKNSYWRILFRPYLGSMIVLSVLAVLVGVSGMATVGLGVPLIDTATGAGTLAQKTPHVLNLLIIVCGAAILHSLLLFFAQYYSVVLAIRAQQDAKTRLFEKMMHASYSYLTGKGRGTMLCDLTNPPQAVYQVVDLFGRMMVSLAQAVLMVGLMVWLSWPATAAVFVLALVWWWKLKKVWGKMAARLGAQIYEWNRQMGQVDVDAIDGIKVVKSHGLEEAMVAKTRALLENQRRPKRVVDMLTRGVVLLNEGAASLIVILLGVISLGFHWIDMNFSELVAFMLAIRRASPSLGTFNSMYLQFSRELKNVDVLDEGIHRTPQENAGTRSVPQVQTVTLSNVSFAYNDSGSFALQGIDLKMKKGELTALVGPSGGGKSTLVHLLLRFYSPNSGGISINDAPLLELRLQEWRRKVGYVSQDVFLFHATIRENICAWNRSIPESEMIRVARLAQIHDFVETLPQGYDTVVGDRGLKLSGGECQRVAIAREILKNPEVFIFDEATSALDNLTEKAVYEAIATLHDRAVVLVIAHRLSTIQSADQIVVLRNGRIEEQGRHESLLKEKGLYAQLYSAPIETAEATHA